MLLRSSCLEHVELRALLLLVVIASGVRDWRSACCCGRRSPSADRPSAESRATRSACRRAAFRAVHHHEAGQVLVLAAQPVGHPGAHARPALQEHAGVHLQHGRRVIVRLRVAGIDERHVVHVLRHVRKDLRHPRAGFAVLLELERRLQHLAAGREEAGLGVGPVEFLAVALSAVPACSRTCRPATGCPA